MTPSIASSFLPPVAVQPSSATSAPSASQEFARMLSQKQAAAQKPVQPPAAERPKESVKQPEKQQAKENAAEKPAEAEPATQPASSQSTAQNQERAVAKADRAAKKEPAASTRTSRSVDAKEAKEVLEVNEDLAKRTEDTHPALAEFLAGLNLPATPAQDSPSGIGLPGRGSDAGACGAQAGTRTEGDAGLLDDAGAGRRGPADLRGDDRLGGVGRGHERAHVQVAADAQAEQTAGEAWQAVAEEARLAVPEVTPRNEVSAAGALGTASGLTSPAARHEAGTVVSLPTPARSPEFPQALGVQLSVLAKGGVQQAELHLNPAEMGPISVQIAIDGTQAQVNFGVDSAATRQIIENGLPELAAAMRDAGFTLSGGGVHQQAQQRGEGPGGGEGSHGDGPAGRAGAGEAEGGAPARINTRVSEGGVDLYA